MQGIFRAQGLALIFCFSISALTGIPPRAKAIRLCAERRPHRQLQGLQLLNPRIQDPFGSTSNDYPGPVVKNTIAHQVRQSIQKQIKESEFWNISAWRALRTVRGQDHTVGKEEKAIKDLISEVKKASKAPPNQKRKPICRPPTYLTCSDLKSCGRATYDSSALPTFTPSKETISYIRHDHNFKNSFARPSPSEYANQAMWRRNAWSQADTQVPCGFAGPTGFDVDTDMRQFSHCQVIVLTVTFGAQDKLHKAPDTGSHRLCYVAFFDLTTAKVAFADRQDSGKHDQVINGWTVVVVYNLPYENPRRNARIPKHLTHRLFPLAEFSVWVDTKLQLKVDPLLLIDQLLLKTGADFAVAQNPTRLSIHEEHKALVAKGMITQDEANAQIGNYTAAGLPPEPLGLPDTSILVRRHTRTIKLLQCLWFGELDFFTHRDQMSFNYVLWRLGFKPSLPATAYAPSTDHKYKDQLSYTYSNAALGTKIVIFSYCEHFSVAVEMGHLLRSGIKVA